MTTDPTTKAWIRNESDERAAHNGCRFDLRRACWAVWWIERYCRLYEGDWAGQPLILRGAHGFDWELPIPGPFYEAGGKMLAKGGKDSLRRARAYQRIVKAGKPVDWQYEITMRLFGWVRYSEHWQRTIRRFRKASIFVSKKSKKSPTLAAWGLYLLCGDGEPGQKVFFAAKDGNQARIAARHAYEMVLSSDELKEDCTTNKNTMSIEHLPTRSILLPLSSGDSQTKKAKEGLNGSLMVDETHVVDRDFMARVGRTGISRSEPVHAEVSTAGDDPQSYGKDQYDYGKEVEAGAKENQELLFACYEAPQNVSDAEILADPIRIGRLANPAWNHTINPEEFLADLHESSRSIREFNAFKQYRLNLWQRSAQPWINIGDWQKCRREFDWTELRGKPCGGGLDLSQTSDMTAFALAFPDDLAAWSAQTPMPTPVKPEEEKPPDDPIAQRRADCPLRLLVWYWLPEEAADKQRQHVDYFQWAKDGYMTFTKTGRVMDYAVIEDEIGELFKDFDIRLMAYDERFAARTIQLLHTRCSIPEDRFYAFPQTVKAYTGPTVFFERLVLAEKLWHNGNPVTDWQIGHVHVDRRRNEGLMPIKPAAETTKKIDGVVASIMALDAACRMPARRSVYETRGLRFIGTGQQ